MNRNEITQYAASRMVASKGNADLVEAYHIIRNMALKAEVRQTENQGIADMRRYLKSNLLPDNFEPGHVMHTASLDMLVIMKGKSK